MSSRPHDALIKLALKSPADAAAFLRELVPAAVRAAVAWETLAREDGEFIDPELADRRSDVLFHARLNAGEPGLVYFLLDHQSTDDPVRPLRILTYQNRIWDRFVAEKPRSQLPPIITVLVSQVRGGWKSARTFEELFAPAVLAVEGLAALVPRYALIVEDLMGLTNEALAGRALGAFPKLALWILRDARDGVLLLESFAFWAPVMVELGQTRPGIDHLEVLFRYLFQVIEPLHLETLRDKIRLLGSHIEEAAMSIAEYLHDEGHKEGRIDTLRDLLVLKFQHLDAEHEARLQAATPEAIGQYLRRLLTADSLAAVFEDVQ